MPDSRRVFVSVAEDSADVHAAALLREAGGRLPGWRFYGLTGPRMRKAGAETLADLVAHAAMLTGVVGLIGRAWRTLRLVEKSWRAAPPDLVVLLDSPELNLRLAALARKLGLRVLYYIAPQTWASREGRNSAIRRDVDRLACILPFEEDYFRRRDVPATYVGHPLFESLRRQAPDDRGVARLRPDGAPLIALLPGSRRHVIDAVLPMQLEILARLRARGQRFRAAISAVSAERGEQIRAIVRGAATEAEIVVADNATLLTAADLVLVASGTATLEVAHYRRPMIVVYDAGPLLRALYPLGGRWIVKTPHLSLVNILAAARIVPEFMPFVPDLDAVARVAGQLLGDARMRELMVRQIDEIVAPLARSSASASVCEIMREMIDRDGR